MRTSLLFVGIFTLFGFSCIVRGDTDSECQDLVYFRTLVVTVQSLAVNFIVVKETDADTICSTLKNVTSAEIKVAPGCEETQSSHKTLLAKLNKKNLENYGILCENPGAIKISMECVNEAKKADEVNSTCLKTFTENFKVVEPPEEANPIERGKLQMVTNKNKITVCSAINEVSSCLKKTHTKM